MGVFLKHYDNEMVNSWNKTFLLINEIKRVSEESGAEFIILFVPDKREFDQIELNRSLSFYDPSSEKININKTYEITIPFLINNNISFINLFPYFYDKKHFKLYNFWDTHWSRNGNALAAKSVYLYLNSNNFLD